MKQQFTKSFSIVGVLGLFVGLAVPNLSQATIIVPGCDFLTTQPGTTFGGVPFVGVPLGTVDLGTLICGSGLLNLGTTDTIIRRLGQADTTNPTPIPIEMVALHLTSGTNFVTLQSERGGPPSTGSIIIGPTTFSSTINVCFDLRQGSLSGPILLSTCDTILSIPLQVIWCPPGFIPGCGNVFTEGDPIGFSAIHNVRVTTPEPAALLLLGFGLIALAAVGRKRLFTKM